MFWCQPQLSLRTYAACTLHLFIWENWHWFCANLDAELGPLLASTVKPIIPSIAWRHAGHEVGSHCEVQIFTLENHDCHPCALLKNFSTHTASGGFFLSAPPVHSAPSLWLLDHSSEKLPLALSVPLFPLKSYITSSLLLYRAIHSKLLLQKVLMASQQEKSFPGKRPALKRWFRTNVFVLLRYNPCSLITFKNNHNHSILTERCHSILASM